MPPNDKSQAGFGGARRRAEEPPARPSGKAASWPGQDPDASLVDEGDFTVAAPGPAGPSLAPGRPSSGEVRQAEPARRGKLVMASRVVEKIAAEAASEAAAGGRSGGLLGIGAKTDLRARPKVDVELSGKTATVDVEVAVAYPVSIRQATDRVRRHIIDRVDELAGVTVTRVDIDVTGFHPIADQRQEKLR